jgi:hypothetical protein
MEHLFPALPLLPALAPSHHPGILSWLIINAASKPLLDLHQPVFFMLLLQQLTDDTGLRSLADNTSWL